MSKVVIETSELMKKYKNGVTALQNLNLKIEEGDCVGYLGPNGAGKTTTIKILTNLIKPTAGHAYICGIDVNKKPKEALRYVGALVELPGIYEYLTPHELLTYLGKVRMMSKVNLNRRIKEVLRTVGIPAWEHKKVRSLSTGMRQRFLIAQALLHNPEILIMDEPVFGLDPKGMKDIRDVIKQLHKENKTVFLSSHLLHEVSEICTKVLLLNKGKIVSFDTVDNLTKMSKTHTIKIELLKPPTKKQIAEIKLIKIIKDINIADGHLGISFDGERNTCSRILTELVSLGLKIVSYWPKSMTLEDIYISIVGEEKGIG
ncbi:ABC transporter ATP-binding protein [Candidatus Aerophobetes bacterium]|uniref:ABC transporter ATP-binding protein n=1 Tax=Aerophobetes bacterium TaxID=2030807 RepID=A0A662D308_UNCAE|nr:MAG: ABC transporter ATP-binding protein [Candidatus Aerophobetes bacterium]